MTFGFCTSTYLIVEIKGFSTQNTVKYGLKIMKRNKVWLPTLNHNILLHSAGNLLYIREKHLATNVKFCDTFVTHYKVQYHACQLIT